jgi:2,3-bisphosphoglycerate-dependent phosphoglycerate mutase
VSDTRLVLIRHGESRAQVEGFVSGHDTCTGLSDHGRAQASALRDRLLATGELRGAAALYTSNLPRAQETASIISPGVGDGALAPTADCSLCEVRPGSAEGRQWTDVVAENPLRCSFRPPWEGGETWASFVARVGQMLLSIAASHEGSTAVVVAHGGIVDASFAVLGATPLFRGFELRTTNTSLTEWVLSEGADLTAWPPPPWRLLRYNDAAHLATAGLSAS